MKESTLWRVIEAMNFNERGYKGAGQYLTTEAGLTLEGMEEVEQFANSKVDELYGKLMEAGSYLGSDDGFSDLLWQIVANGEEFYNNITVDKAKEMIDNEEYTESFGYAFHAVWRLEEAN
jgi:hypothetical protein